MEVKLNQLEDIIRKSKCAICGLLLSVGPLMVISEDGSQIRCGRCKKIECQTFTRNVLLENIAEALTFPCSYEKCKQWISWGQVEEHEKVCPFRTVYCPMLCQGRSIFWKECSSVIEVADLQSHFSQAHNDFLQLGSIKSINLQVKHYVVLLLIVDNLKFLVYLSDSASIVFSLDPLDKYTKYNVLIRSDENEDILVSYLNQEIIRYNEKEHCFKCFEQICTLKCHPHSQAHQNKGASFVRQTFHKFHKHLVELLGSPKQLIFTVNLIADQKRKNSEDSTATTGSQCHKNEDERKEDDDDDEKYEIVLPCKEDDEKYEIVLPCKEDDDEKYEIVAMPCHADFINEA